MSNFKFQSDELNFQPQHQQFQTNKIRKLNHQNRDKTLKLVNQGKRGRPKKHHTTPNFELNKENKLQIKKNRHTTILEKKPKSNYSYDAIEEIEVIEEYRDKNRPTSNPPLQQEATNRTQNPKLKMKSRLNEEI